MCAWIWHNFFTINFPLSLFTNPVFNFMEPVSISHDLLIWSSSICTYSSTISSSAMGQGCYLSSMGMLLFCSVCFPSTAGICSQGSSAPGSMTHSGTRHLFCLAGGVSSPASPCIGTSMTIVGLGVWD